MTASPLRCRTGLSSGAQRPGKTATLVPSRWSFARRHMLGTGELIWTPMSRAGTRGIRRPAGAVENVRRPEMIRPRDLVPSPSLGGPPAAGRQRVFVGASSLCRRAYPGWCVVACHCGGTGDRGLFAPQSTCPGSSWKQGSHLPCTSTAPLATPRHFP